MFDGSFKSRKEINLSSKGSMCLLRKTLVANAKRKIDERRKQQLHISSAIKTQNHIVVMFFVDTLLLN